MNPQPHAQRPPDRASHQEPERESLARSRPESPLRATSNSSKRSSQRPINEAETRAFGLRDRKALRPSLVSDASLRLDKSSPSRRLSGLQAFAAPPRRVSRKILPSDLSFKSPIVTRGNKLDRGLPDSPDDQLASELSNATGEVNSHTGLHEGLEEPDLPPTPTQLGLERPPARPKGLLSSSPTMQHGSWGKRRTTDHLERSPSKLRNVQYGEGDEDLLVSNSNMAQGLFPEPVLGKRRLTTQLATEIKQLGDDIVELENWSRSPRYDVDDTELDMGKLVSILCEDPIKATPAKPGPYDMSISSFISTLLPFSTKCTPITSEEHPPPNPFALDKLSQAEPYLTIFAPLKLKAYSNTYCGSDPDMHLEKHILELSAPCPFPSRQLQLSIHYETDPETQSVLSISVPVDIENKVPIYLRQWIESRLANPLLKLDLSGLCWGINRYWEALISRAQLWSRLEGQYQGLIRSRGTTRDTDKLDDFQNPEMRSLSNMSLRKILPHLERTSMLFESEGGESLRAYFSCELTIDEWACEPRLVPGFSVSAPPMMNGRSGSKVEQDVKRLFHTILSEKQSGRIGADVDINTDAIVHAAEHILGALFCDEPEKHVFSVRAKSVCPSVNQQMDRILDTFSASIEPGNLK